MLHTNPGMRHNTCTCTCVSAWSEHYVSKLQSEMQASPARGWMVTVERQARLLSASGVPLYERCALMKCTMPKLA